MKVKEKISKIKENKVYKVISTILYVILVIVILLMLIVVALQRFSNNTISLGGYRMFNIATGSMMPKYEIGDVLISKDIDPSELKEGEDIVYKGEKGTFKGKIVTHQILSISQDEDGKYQFITKGIANEDRDPMISQDQVYGKIIYKVQTLSLLSKLTTNLFVFYFIIFIPIALIIYKQIKNIVLSLRGDDDENEDEDREDSKEYKQDIKSKITDKEEIDQEGKNKDEKGTDK